MMEAGYARYEICDKFPVHERLKMYLTVHEGHKNLAQYYYV